MVPDSVVLHGTLRPDGTLELPNAIPLPPGQVQVTVRALKERGPKDDVWEVLRRIWADQKARGFVPGTKAEIDAEIEELRDEAEERFREIENLVRDDRSTQPPASPPEGSAP